jgi:beta-lactamase class C
MKFLLGIILIVSIGLGFFLLSRSNHEASAKPVVKKDTIKVVKVKKNISAVHDPNPFVESALKEFEGFVKTAIANRQAPGAAVAIVKDTNIIFLKGYGLRNATKHDSVNTRTVFRLGSVSKSVTATLVAILVNDGVLHWDDAVIKYLPDFHLKSEEATKNLTLRHLLSHTIGLPYHAYTIMIEDHAPFDTLVDHLKDLDLVGKPGELYSYQNVGFSLIGSVIEKATGKKLEEVFIEKLFQPLDMSDASASFEKIMMNDNVAMPHYFIRPTTISSAYYSVAPAGGLNASIQDMGMWLKALMGNQPKILPEKNVNEIFEPQVRAIARNHNFWEWKRVRKSYYGLGWRIITFNNDTIEYHGGYVNNYRCEVALNRKKKIAIAVLVNSPGMLADHAIPKFFKIYDHYLDSINHWKRKPVL